MPRSKARRTLAYTANAADADSSTLISYVLTGVV